MATDNINTHGRSRTKSLPQISLLWIIGTFALGQAAANQIENLKEKFGATSTYWNSANAKRLEVSVEILKEAQQKTNQELIDVRVDARVATEKSRWGEWTSVRKGVVMVRKTQQ
ncbi:hypothetical protein VE02_00108 [Pseudogymnoascus sp. 03VT05]|nr:hypothetical protein VE02_00108 [Pseudogymnoascus sp. 03VT05]